MTELSSLAYISKNTIQGDAARVEAEIADILAIARRRNRDLNVTGALLYSGGYFCQVLEGEREVLEDLFESIQMDGRHGEVTVLHFEPIAERSFAEWAMALAGIEAHHRFDLDGLLRSKDEMRMAETGHHLITVLDQLVRQRQGLLSSGPGGR